MLPSSLKIGLKQLRQDSPPPMSTGWANYWDAPPAQGSTLSAQF
ncbi:hypothetical protein L345_04812, partial [Ophiophagus hannah]